MNARKAWSKHAPPLEAVLQALAWQVVSPQWTRDDGQYIPLPTTWLNRGGWEDEPTRAAKPAHSERSSAIHQALKEVEHGQPS